MKLLDSQQLTAPKAHVHLTTANKHTGHIRTSRGLHTIYYYHNAVNTVAKYQYLSPPLSLASASN